MMKLPPKRNSKFNCDVKSYYRLSALPLKSATNKWMTNRAAFYNRFPSMRHSLSP